MTNHLIGWAIVTDSAWRPSFTQTRTGLEIRFTGACPRCGHQTTLGIPYVNPNLGGRATRADAEPFTMICRCGYPHPGHPEDDISCGAYWREQIGP